MKLKHHFVFILFLTVSSAVFADEADTLKRVKQGLVLGALPTVSYDSDLGFQYGLYGNMYHFGDGSRYPQYDHFMFLEYSKYTKGSQGVHFFYDTDCFLKPIRTTFDVTYQHDVLHSFFGFNGYDAVYSSKKFDENRAFYSYDCETFKIKTDFQKHFGISNWGWVAGINLSYFNPNSVNIAKLNADNNHLPNEPELYDKYVEWGIISADETEKNWVNYLKLGIKYDSRNHDSAPSKGIFSEVLIQTAPAFLFNTFPHTKFAVIHKQYFPLLPERMVFAYRLFYQTSLGNHKIPFYALPLMLSSFETNSALQGLGGGKSLRGILHNRVVGEGFVMGNFEVRIKLFQLSFINQYFDYGINLFFDTGCITKEVDIDKQVNALPESERQKYFTNEGQTFHSSGGAGLKIIMNDNFIMSMDFGHAFDKRDGSGFRTYFNMNYVF